MNSKLQLINSFIGVDAIKWAKELGYTDEQIIALEGDTIKFQTKYKATYDWMMKNSQHNMDKRDPVETSQNIVMSWIVADYIELVMQSNGIDIKKSPLSNARNLVAKPKNAPTFSATLKSGIRNVYMVVDYTGFWERNGKITFRDDKYKHIAENNGIVLAVDIKNKKVAVFNIKNNAYVYSTLSDHHLGGKPSNAIDVRNVKFMSLKPVETSTDKVDITKITPKVYTSYSFLEGANTVVTYSI
jgi:hypothetical protein